MSKFEDFKVGDIVKGTVKHWEKVGTVVGLNRDKQWVIVDFGDQSVGIRGDRYHNARMGDWQLVLEYRPSMYGDLRPWDLATRWDGKIVTILPLREHPYPQYINNGHIPYWENDRNVGNSGTRGSLTKVINNDPLIAVEERLSNVEERVDKLESKPAAPVGNASIVERKQMKRVLGSSDIRVDSLVSNRGIVVRTKALSGDAIIEIVNGNNEHEGKGAVVVSRSELLKALNITVDEAIRIIKGANK